MNNKILNPNSEATRRAFQLAVYISILVFALGSAAITGAPGVLCFAIFALSSENNSKDKKHKQLIKLRIKL